MLIPWLLLQLLLALAAEHNEVKTLPHLDRQLLLYTIPPLETDPVKRDALILSTKQPCAKEGPRSSAATYSRMICASSGAWWAARRSFNQRFGGPPLRETDSDADVYDSYVKWIEAANEAKEFPDTFRVSQYLPMPNATYELYMQIAMLVSKLMRTLSGYNRCSLEIRSRLEKHSREHELGPDTVTRVGCDCQGHSAKLDNIHNQRFYASVYAFALRPLCALAMADRTLKNRPLPYIDAQKGKKGAEAPQADPTKTIRLSEACVRSGQATRSLWEATLLEASYQRKGLSIPPSEAIDIRGLSIPADSAVSIRGFNVSAIAKGSADRG